MDKYSSKTTIEYYNKNAENYFDNTVNIDMYSLYERFIKDMPKNGKILDVGCGSGRDSKFFLGKGYDVIAIDASKELCKIASQFLGIKVLNYNLLNLDYNMMFDGVWACASLLHISRDRQLFALERLVKSLKINGILYGSWKYGVTERIDDGRAFCDMTEKSIMELLDKLDNIELIDIWKTKDNKLNSSDDWINLLIRRVK